MENIKKYYNVNMLVIQKLVAICNLFFKVNKFKYNIAVASHIEGSSKFILMTKGLSMATASLLKTNSYTICYK